MSEQKMIRFDGPTGIKQANKLIEKYKNVKVGSRLAGLKVTEVRDFSKGYKKLPKDNFVTIVMGESSISIRPSGTEPLLRIYCYGFGKTSAVAKKNLKNILNIIK
jgi:phosphoglucomutase